MKKVFVTKGKVWKYPGMGAWHFVYVDKKLSTEIKNLKLKTKGFHFVPIKATVGKTVWKTSLFPTKESVYLIALKAAVRKKEGIFDGDTVTISFTFQINL